MTAAARPLSLGAAGIAVLLSIPLLDATPRLVFNGSASAPIGFYTVSSQAAGRGDLVLVSLPERVRFLVDQRHYLPANVPLLKRIIAANGDRICRIGDQILVNGSAVATAMKRDSSGRPMPVWDGCRVLNPSEVLLLQDHPRSFDGRYFGAVDRRLIVGKARPLWLFNKASSASAVP